MYAFLALILADLHLSHPLFLERNVYGFSTKNTIDVVNHAVSKNFPKQAYMFFLALDLQLDAVVGHKPRLCIKTLLLHFFGLLLGIALDSEHKEDWGDSFCHFIYGDPSAGSLAFVRMFH